MSNEELVRREMEDRSEEDIQKVIGLADDLEDTLVSLKNNQKGGQD